MSYPNDNAANATTVSGTSGSITPFHFDGITDPATSETGESVYGAGETLWWKWTAPSSAQISFTTSGSPSDDADPDGLDTKMQVFDTSPTGTLVASNDDGAGVTYGYNSRCTFTPVSGHTYYIQVDMYGTGQAGTLHLSWAAPPPPAPTAGTWTEAAGRDTHTAFTGDDVIVTGTNLDTVTTVTVGGFSQPFTATDATHLTIHVSGTARSGPINVANVTGNDNATGDATVLFYGPWIQPPDEVTTAPNFAASRYTYNYGASEGLYPTQPDTEGAPSSVGAGTNINVAQWVFSDPADPSWKWATAGTVILAKANVVAVAMPPIDYAPILAADPSIWDVDTETPGGIAVSDIDVTANVQVSGQWTDGVDNKTSSDLAGDLWQTAVEVRRLDSSDWTSATLSSVQLASVTWPSKTWLAALPLDLTVPTTPPGTALTISTEDDSGAGSRIDNKATRNAQIYTEPLATLTWTEYASGVAWVVALDRLIDQPGISVPTLAVDSIGTNQRKNIAGAPDLLMTWTYRPPRYRLSYEEPPVLTIPPLRQWPRDDGLRRNPGRTAATSRQGSLRRGPRGTYT